MDESKRDQLLTLLLQANHSITTAYIKTNKNHPLLTIGVTKPITASSLSMPAALAHLKLQILVTTKPNILRAPLPFGAPRNVNQACQNEPIHLGCQIQPSGKPWVGTAGAPVTWTPSDGKQRWGILSNWHVMADGNNGVGHTQHQPDQTKPAAARLSEWTQVTADKTNYIDTALADALIDGYHTIDRLILDVGLLQPEPVTPTVGTVVVKSGRTTGYTNGVIAATGAAVKVGYGNFDATFADQILIEDQTHDFSAAGDSGSLVVAEACKCPVGLLFAGGGGTTVANPIKRVCDTHHLSFDL